MTVRDLIAQLKRMDPDAPVFLHSPHERYNSGDGVYEARGATEETVTRHFYPHSQWCSVGQGVNIVAPDETKPREQQECCVIRDY